MRDLGAGTLGGDTARHMRGSERRTELESVESERRGPGQDKEAPRVKAFKWV